MKVLDTDIFIDFLRGVDTAINFFKENNDKIAFSAITESELLSGEVCNNKNERSNLIHFLAQFNKIEVDNPLAQIAGDVRREFGLEVPDAIIAASAMIIDAQLVTRNTKHFENIKGLEVRKPY